MHAHWPPLHTQHGGSWQRRAMSMPALAVQVKQWQEEQRDAAQNGGYVCTILGRRRLLPDASGGGRMVSTPGLRSLHRLRDVLCPPPAVSLIPIPCRSPGWCGVEGAPLTAGTYNALAA